MHGQSFVARLLAWGLVCVSSACVLFSGTMVLALSGPVGDLPGCVDARQHGLEQARDICLRELSAAEHLGDDDGTERALFQLAMIARSHGDTDQAVSWHENIQRRAWFHSDWKAQYRLAREQGILAYTKRDMSSALTFFRAALAIARAHEQPELEARSHNDLGNAYRHVDALREAIDAYRASLAIKRELDDPQIGTTLSNIADLLLAMGDVDQAATYYEEALDRHRQLGSENHVAHTLESMALLLDQRRRRAEAVELAEEAYARFVALGTVADRLRAGALLAQLRFEAGDNEATNDVLTELEVLSDASDMGLPARWYRVSAEFLAETGNLDAARQLLDRALQNSASWSDSDHIATLSVQAELAESAGELVRALELQKRLREMDDEHAKERHQRELASSRVLLEVAEAEHRIERLQLDNEVQRLAISSHRARTVAVGLGGLLGIVLVVAVAASILRRRSERDRQHRIRLERRLDQYRQKAQDLRTSSERLAGVLDASDLGLVAISLDHRVIFANTAAQALLGLNDPPIKSHLDELFDTAVSSTIVVDSEGSIPASVGGRQLDLKFQTLDLEEQIQVVILQDPEQPAAMDDGLLPMINRHFDRVQSFGGLLQGLMRQGGVPESLKSRWLNIDQELKALSEQLQPVQDESRGIFREHLVKLMTQSLEVWERETGTTRVDLAERSGIWRVTIDEGRLRTRAMDRYLQLARLPKKPRWREVVRTAYFVLSECPGELSLPLENLAERVRSDAARLGMS